MVGKKIGSCKNHMFLNILAKSYHLSEFGLFYLNMLWTSQLFNGRNLETSVYRSSGIIRTMNVFFLLRRYE